MQAPSFARRKYIMFILGIDPGKAKLGWGVVEAGNNDLKCIDYGVIETSKELGDPERLKIIFNEMNSLIRRFKPDALAVETLYFFKNRKTAMGVAQSRGVVLLAGAKKKLSLYEFTPLQAKMAITGYGRAEKKQVQEMVKKLLYMKDIPKPDDAADALAMAICCSREMR